MAPNSTSDAVSVTVQRDTVVELTLTPGVPGDSAYTVAVDAGFVGTVAEWLASLIGPQGAPGVVALTAAAYAALPVKDPTILYVITP